VVNTADIEHLRSVLDEDDSLNEFTIREGSTKDTPTYRAIENVLKGPEVEMADHYYDDKGGHRREKARVKWWKAKATTLDQLAMIPKGTQLFDAKGRKVNRLPSSPVTKPVPRYSGPLPVVVGHYWNSGRPKTLNERVACVDYSAGRGGPLVVYRWSGERTLSVDHLVRTD